MILAIDVGNTNIVLGGIVDDQQVFSARLASDRNKTADQYALDIQGILTMHKVRTEAIEGGILSSVVPYLQTVIPNAVKLLTGVDLLVVGPGIKTGLSIRMDNPASVGSDLIVAAVAARAKYKAPIAIVDMGTATTLSVVAKNGNYIGGMIIPGLWTSMNALSAHAAQLPYIDLNGPAKLLGTNTIDCMRCWTASSTGWRRSWAKASAPCSPAASAPSSSPTAGTPSIWSRISLSTAFGSCTAKTGPARKKRLA